MKIWINRLMLTPTIFIHSCVFAQTKLYLSPGIGTQAMRSIVVDRTNADSDFKAFSGAFTPAANLSLELNLNPHWLLTSGWIITRSVLGYKYGNHGPSVFRDLPLLVNRFHFGAGKKLLTSRLIRLNPTHRLSNIPTGDKYLFVFKIYALTGGSYDLVSAPFNFHYGRTSGTSLFIKFRIQFFNIQNDQLQLDFILSRGNELISIQRLEYILNGREYSASIGSKGTYLGIHATYPIKIASWTK